MVTGIGQLFRSARGLNELVRRRSFFGLVGNVNQQKFAIPAYFHSGSSGDPHWSKAASAKSLLGIAVVNPASGPGYTAEFRGPGGAKWKEFNERIEQLRLAGAAVVGYVTTNYRDSTGDNTVQGEHTFTVSGGTNVTTERTGWWTGFGPIRVRSKTPAGGTTTPPTGLTVSEDYFWVAVSDTTGAFATSKANALNGVAVTLGAASNSQAIHVMGLSRNLENIGNVLAEIDEYYLRWPGIDGIFCDEMNNSGEIENVAYYRQIFDHVKAKGGKALVIQNPGTGFPLSLRRVANVFLSFEGRSSAYAAHKAEFPGFRPSQRVSFWHAVYDCPAEAMPAIIASSRAKGAGYIYVTDKNPEQGNTWNEIATYYGEEVRLVGLRNNPPVLGR